jgi:Periplasmic binding protein domain
LNTNPRPILPRAVVAFIAATSLVAAACGSSTAKTAATTPASATTVAATATTPAAAGGILLDEAKATVAQFSKQPTVIPTKTPIGKAVPTGKKVYFISCGAPSCEAEIPILKQAATILGWELTAISTDPTKPEQIPAAWDRVVKEKPDGVLYTGTPRSQVSTQFDAAVKNGTKIAACCVTDAPTNGLVYTISTPDQVGELGKIIASWVVADANGKPAKALYLDLPDFPILSALKKEFNANLSRMCAACTSDTINFGLADLAKASDQVVSFLRAHPDVKYVIQSTDSTFSLPAALDAAGLKDIRIFGEGPTSATLADIDAGRQAGTMAFSFYEVMFSMMDSLARSFAGVPVVAEGGPPNWILTKGSFPTGVDTFPSVPDVVAQYTKLWGK